MRPLLPALMLIAALPAAAESPPAMSEAERGALHAEIRAYLLANPEILTEMIGAARAAAAGREPRRTTAR